MMRRNRTIGYLLLGTAFILFIFLLMQPLSVWFFRSDIDILFPKGIIAREQLNLLLIIQAIMLLVILPVYALTFLFSWRYRADQSKATYDPDLIDNRLAEYIWWGIPLILTLIIAVLTWVKTVELDPYKPIQSDKKTVVIQVVALQWKWLFIYPEEKIASINFFQIPENTPVHFDITADAPMNSFWIPQLGGQIYAMPAMTTQLNLIADKKGEFPGSSANLSGEGFAGMRFIAKATSEEDFQKWVKTAQESSIALNLEEYNRMVTPSQNAPVALYQLKDTDLFNQIVMKYMHPQEIQSPEKR